MVIAIVVLDRLRLDDPVGAISVHGVVGLYGLFLVPLTNAEASLLSQLAGAGAIFFWVFACSLLVWFVLRLTLGIRVSEADEYQGSDVTDCGVEAYPEFVSNKQA